MPAVSLMSAASLLWVEACYAAFVGLPGGHAVHTSGGREEGRVGGRESEKEGGREGGGGADGRRQRTGGREGRKETN